MKSLIQIVTVLAFLFTCTVTRVLLAQQPPNSIMHQHYYDTCHGMLDYQGLADGWCVYDDFVGQAYNDNFWKCLVIGSTSDIALAGPGSSAIYGQLRLTAGSTVSDEAVCTFGDKYPFSQGAPSRAIYEMQFRFDHTAVGDRLWRVGVTCSTGAGDLYWDSSDGSVFKFRTTSSGNICGGAGTTCTTLDSSFLLTDDGVDWRIAHQKAPTPERWELWRDGIRVACHANGVSVGCTDTVDLPADFCEPSITIRNRTGAATRIVDVDYFAVIARRGDWAR